VPRAAVTRATQDAALLGASSDACRRHEARLDLYRREELADREERGEREGEVEHGDDESTLGVTLGVSTSWLMRGSTRCPAG
jgi:hypothetical protein